MTHELYEQKVVSIKTLSSTRHARTYIKAAFGKAISPKSNHYIRESKYHTATRQLYSIDADQCTTGRILV